MVSSNIGPKTRTQVYVDLDTKRVLGFAPEGVRPLFPPGTRFEAKTPFDAMELDKWVDKYADEQKRDIEANNFRQMQREAPTRKAIADALRARSAHLDPLNRDLNDAFLGLMEHRYQKTMEAKTKVDTFLVAQAYDESVSGEDLAMKNTNISLT